MNIFGIRLFLSEFVDVLISCTCLMELSIVGQRIVSGWVGLCVLMLCKPVELLRFEKNGVICVISICRAILSSPLVSAKIVIMVHEDKVDKQCY